MVKFGTLGTLKTTDFSDREAAEKDAQRLVRSEMRRGYAEAEAPEGTDTAVAKRMAEDVPRITALGERPFAWAGMGLGALETTTVAVRWWMSSWQRGLIPTQG